MRLDLFDYQLPSELIAQKPITPRDNSRLFVYDRQKDKIDHCRFFNLPDLLSAGDVLVLNNTKVFPARLVTHRKSGGKIEIFLLRELKAGEWEVLIGGKGRENEEVIISKKLVCFLKNRLRENIWLVKFSLVGEDFWVEIDKVGQVPTPPYIKKESDLDSYQTVFAKSKGSVAAPTAGLHFTKKILQKLRQGGVEIEYLTLHVGLGTFAPVKTDEIEKHKMHAEWASLDRATALRLNRAKSEKRKIIGVGTTSVRTLESFVNSISSNNKDEEVVLKPQSKWIDTFIYPGYEFKFIDSMITNFHLPKSSLLMLLAAFLSQNKKPEKGIEILHRLYQEAIKEQYRFFSYGDSMLIF